MKIYLFLLLFITIGLHGCVTNLEEEKEEEIKELTQEKQSDDSTLQLSWSGDTDKFKLTARKGIQLNDPNDTAGQAYMSFPNTSVTDTSWEFGINYQFNPSTKNHARFYLAATNNCLTEPLDGYYLQIGGRTDQIFFYRQEGMHSELLTATRELMNGDKSPQLFIKVTCSADGQWSIYSKHKKEETYTLESECYDKPQMLSTCCGILCIYTKSRRQGINFHHIQLTHHSFPEAKPDIPPTGMQPPHTNSHIHHTLLFNEIMYDPSPNGTKYIELYNPSDSTVAFSSLKLIRTEAFTPSNQLSRISHEVELKPVDNSKGIIVAPHKYICLTSDIQILNKNHSRINSTIIAVHNFPEITRINGCLILTSNEPQPRTIDVCYYDNSMHDRRQRLQGYSLEKKAPELASDSIANWGSCHDNSGGTPGRKNSCI